jgi:hypothetical protein
VLKIRDTFGRTVGRERLRPLEPMPTSVTAISTTRFSGHLMRSILDRCGTEGLTAYQVAFAALSFLSFLPSFFGREPFLIDGLLNGLFRHPLAHGLFDSLLNCLDGFLSLLLRHWGCPLRPGARCKGSVFSGGFLILTLSWLSRSTGCAHAFRGRVTIPAFVSSFRLTLRLSLPPSSPAVATGTYSSSPVWAPWASGVFSR